jgi:arabinoxylan arabinofuranohydrolase
MKKKRVLSVLLAAAVATGTLFSGYQGSFLGSPAVVRADEVTTFNEDFEGGSTSGRGRGGAESLEVISEGAHGGSKCLKVSGRTSNWHGVIWGVSQFAGTRIKISCWVKSASPSVKLTADEGDPWPNITTVDTSSGKWTKVEGEYSVSALKPANGVYLETEDTEDIYVDDLSIVSMGKVKEPPVIGSEVVENSGMEGDIKEWKAAGDAAIAANTSEHAEGDQSILVTGRKAATDGVSQDLTGYLKTGKEYAFSAKVKLANASADQDYVMTLQCGGETADVVAKGKVSKSGWGTVKGSFTIPEDADLSNAVLTICADKDTGDFYVDEVSVIEQVTMATDGLAKKIGNSNPLSDTFYGADPFAMPYKDRVYIYMTNDTQQFDAEEKDAQGFAKKDNGYGAISTIKVLSSDDMVNWTDHGEILVAGKNPNNPDGVAKWANNSWAPAAAHKTIDGKEKFFLYFADNGNGIGVLEADSPIGPFYEPEVGSQLIPPDRSSQLANGVEWLFDPAVIVDSKGDGYLYYGGGVPSGKEDHPATARVVKLKDNMVETDGDAAIIDAPGLFEDSGIHEYNGTYYYSYCSNFSNNLDETGRGNICYMTSKNPMGPFEFQGQVLTGSEALFGAGGNNHHAMFQFQDKWYITYHSQTLGQAAGKHNGYRSTHIDALSFNEDGSINPVDGTMEGVAQLKKLNPYQRIEAETIAWQSGVKIANCDQPGAMVAEKNRKLTGLVNNNWTSISDADFGTKGTKSFSANVATATGMNIEVHLDSVTSDPVKVLNVAPTGGDDTFKVQTWDLSGIKGVHKVFFVFKSDEAKNKMDMDYFSFAENNGSAAPSNGGNTSGTKPTATPSNEVINKDGSKTKTEEKTNKDGSTTQTKTTIAKSGAVTKIVATTKKAGKEVATETYKVKGGKATLSKEATNSKNVTVGATVTAAGKTFKITSIGANAFKNNKKITTVTLGKNVTKIGKNAFMNAKKLKTVIIKGKVTKIEKNAFKGIKKKATFKVPKKQYKKISKLIKKSGAKKPKIKKA